MLYAACGTRHSDPILIKSAANRKPVTLFLLTRPSPLVVYFSDHSE